MLNFKWTYILLIFISIVSWAQPKSKKVKYESLFFCIGSQTENKTFLKQKYYSKEDTLFFEYKNQNDLHKTYQLKDNKILVSDFNVRKSFYEGHWFHDSVLLKIESKDYSVRQYIWANDRYSSVIYYLDGFGILFDHTWQYAVSHSTRGYEYYQLKKEDQAKLFEQINVKLKCDWKRDFGSYKYGLDSLRNYIAKNIVVSDSILDNKKYKGLNLIFQINENGIVELVFERFHRQNWGLEKENVFNFNDENEELWKSLEFEPSVLKVCEKEYYISNSMFTLAIDKKLY